jgi:asparagine synthase (glutamine-hydrolysing)
MCGIAGFIGKKPAEATSLHRMLASIGHRGPDSFSGFVEGGVALGTARLAIVDLLGGIQPALSEDRKVAVVFNGEIFNYLDLRRELIEKGAQFKTRSEVETLLQLYLAEGVGFVERLNGQFAIAVWDGRSGDLHLFRDRFGIRPLFWTKTGDGICFGSEIKAILASGVIEPRLDPRSLVETFRFWTNIGDTTAFENVRQLPPAHMLSLSSGGELRVRRYWTWPFSHEVEPLELPSDEAYFQRFREEFEASLNRQRMADVQVASYLSGGIDSSVVAARLSRIAPGLKTYSIAFEDGEYDESAAQKLVAESLGLDHTTETVAGSDIAKIFPQVVWQTEAPLFRTAPSPLYLLSRRVHADGIKVVMTGEGADEILLGYDLFREANIRAFWRKQPQSNWRAALFRRLYAYLPQYRNPRYFNLVLDFYRPTLDAPDRHFAMAPRWANGQALEQYFSDDLRAKVGAFDPVAEFDRWIPEGYASADHVGRAQYVEIASLLGNYLLSSQGDRMSLSHGVEGRYPYLDNQFVDFCARLPRRLKLRGMRDKFILRNAFADSLPEAVRNRPKVAYQAPDMKAFFSDGKAVDYAEHLFSPERIKVAGYFDPVLAEQLMTKGKSFQLARAGMRDNAAFTLILSTMLLDEIFVRGERNMTPDIRIPQTLELV